MRSATILALTLLLGGPLALAQERTDEARLERLERFLATRPFHDQIFEQFHRTLVESGVRAEVASRYAARVQESPDDVAARIVLARLEARASRAREALELLDAVELEGHELALLRGRLHLEVSEPEAAAPLLRAAVDSARDGGGRDAVRDAEAGLELLASARLLLRDREGAANALVEYAELSPQSFAVRMEAAARLEDAGLDDAARGQYGVAIALAEGDPAREVRALLAAGGVSERLGQLAVADEHYAAASERLGPGHWQRRPLFERRLRIRRTLGTLDELCAELRERAGLGAVDPDVYILLSRALVETGEEVAVGEALAVLRRAAEAFPDSIDVARALAGRLGVEENAQPAVAELQRVAARHPRELGLHREAGLLLASAGDLAGAETQWELELARAPDSVELHLDLAALQARFGRDAQAEALLRRAMERAPGDLRPVRTLLARGAPTTLLSRVERDAAGDADLLEEVAYEWLGLEDPERAVAALEAAVAAARDGEEERLLRTLVALRASYDEIPEERLDVLRLALLADAAAERAQRIGDYAELLPTTGGESQVKADVGRLDLERSEAADVELAARLHLVHRAGKPDRALELCARLGDRAERREEALRHELTLLRRRGDVTAELAAWTRLGALGGALEEESLEERSKLLRRAGRVAEARGIERQLVEAAPRSRRILRELAERESAARDLGRAIELYRRVVDLDPSDAEARLDLAQAMIRDGQRESALEHLAIALGARSAEVRGRAREVLLRGLLRNLSPGLQAALLEAELERSQLDLPRGLLLVQLLEASGDADRAVDLLQRLSSRFGHDPTMQETTTALIGLSTRAMALPGAREAACRGSDAEALQLALQQLDLGQAAAALRVLDDADPVEAARVLLAGGDPSRAARVLRQAIRAAKKDDAKRLDLLRRLAVAYRVAGSPARAATALEEALTLGDGTRELERWPLLRELGALNVERRSRSGQREAGKQMMRALDASRGLLRSPELSLVARDLHEKRVLECVRFHQDARQERTFAEMGLRAAADDLAMTRALLEHDWQMRRADVDRARARLDTRPMSVWTDAEWTALRDRFALPPGEERREPGAWGRIR